MRLINTCIIIFVFFLNIFSTSFSAEIQEKESSELKNKESIKKEKEPNFMERRKAKKRALVKEIYEKTNIASLMDLNNAAKQLSSISSELKNVSVTYKSIYKQKKSSDKKYKIVLNDAKVLIWELNEINSKLRKKLLSIQIMSKDLKSMKKQMKQIDDSIEIWKMQIERHVWVLYKINNDYYNALEWLDEVKLLFKSDNIAETLSQEDLIKMLSLKTQELLWKLEDSRTLKAKFLQKVYVKRAQYIDTVNAYKAEIELLNEKKKFILDLLLMLRNNKKEVDKIYDRLHKKRVDLKRQQISLTKSFFEKTKDSWLVWWTWEVKSKNLDLSEILKHTIKTDGDKFLSWPTRWIQRITAYFRDEWYLKRFWWEHDGIDIAVPQKSPIYATAAWYVYYVADNDSDYYNYIVVVHNYWYISIYWHVFKSFVKRWDIVKRWELIAASWWEKWTRWAWKKSTWAHLHFEVYKNGQLIDPFSALDLSVYKNRDKLPTNWKLKYVKDSLTRKISLASLRYLPEWLNHEQRQKIFLSRAAWGFNSLTWWTNAWSLYWIDPDVWICIWFAESWLWNNTTTRNNIWNVWNNDRWDRQWYDSPGAGMRAIFYTLNNRYLKKYHTIDQLSRFWNKDSHIFSSSDYNWQKNMIKCLSVIKWHPVDEYYPFRTISKSSYAKLLQLAQANK